MGGDNGAITILNPAPAVEKLNTGLGLFALKMGGNNGAITILNPAPAVEKLNTDLGLIAFTIFSRVQRDFI